MKTQTAISDIYGILNSQKGAGGQPQLVSATRALSLVEYTLTATQTQSRSAIPTTERPSTSSTSGELPPQPPRIFCGRDELIERIVGLTQRLTPIALLGAGGIGKTSIILTVLHDSRVKQQFSDNRWFIRCDEFPASLTNFLRRLSQVIGAGIENPEDLTPLRRYLSSKEMVIVLDNAESILDPLGSSAQEIYTVANELTRFSNVCLCITSRISTIPPDCEILEIPTLSMEAARETFYRIYKCSKQPDSINEILGQLDFHPLSINLLATVAQYNKWDTERLTREWERQRTAVLRAQHSGSLATTIELSLSSPMFRELGPDARELLGVVAFFPQGINERNADWLFPTISDGSDIFDKFCILSLTYRTNGFITMLAPLRDHLRPKDPTSSLLLGVTKERYFSQFSACIDPGGPGFEESRWITSEDVNVEHLLDVFTSVDGGQNNVWDVCAVFMNHLYWHKPRLVTLGPKIEALPDDHPFKPQCLRCLSSLFDRVGNWAERKRILAYALELWREQGNGYWVTITLTDLASVNQLMGLSKEGIQQAKEASEIFEQLDDAVGQAGCLISLALSLHRDEQLDAAGEAASHVIDLFPEKGGFRVCEAHRILGIIYREKGDREKAIHHFELDLRIASSLNFHQELFWAHFFLADLFSKEGRFNDAHAHVEQAKPHAADDTYLLARAFRLQARLWNKQYMFEEAGSEALRALNAFEKLGATGDAEDTRKLLEEIDLHALSLGLTLSDKPANDGELIGPTLLVVCINSSCSGGITESE